MIFFSQTTQHQQTNYLCPQFRSFNSKQTTNQNTSHTSHRIYPFPNLGTCSLDRFSRSECREPLGLLKPSQKSFPLEKRSSRSSVPSPPTRRPFKGPGPRASCLILPRQSSRRGRDSWQLARARSRFQRCVFFQSGKASGPELGEYRIRRGWLFRGGTARGSQAGGSFGKWSDSGD